MALAECCFSSLNRGGIGAEIDIPATSLSSTSALFSESPSRIILSFPTSSLALVEELAARANCPITILGKVGGNRLSIKLGEEEVVSVDVDELETGWRGSLAKKLEAKVMAASGA